MSIPNTTRVRRKVATPTGARRFRMVAVLGAALTVVGSVNAPAALAASSTVSAVFTGDLSTVMVGQTVYARQGATVSLTVGTGSETQCVQVTGAKDLGIQSSATPRSNWTFTTTAPAGDGAQAFTVAASN